MPIYEYECGKCGHRLEAIQKFSDEPLTDCPECKKPALERLISPAAFHLKGTGWYKTDFRGGGSSKKSADKENKDSKGESKSDSTPSSAESKSDKKASTGTAD